jgi:hypothetical protein
MNVSPTVPCKHCGRPTFMVFTQQCDSCWEERRSGKFAALEAENAALRGKLADAESDCKRLHTAFMDAKYPTVLPTRGGRYRMRSGLFNGDSSMTPCTPLKPFRCWQYRKLMQEEK